MGTESASPFHPTPPPGGDVDRATALIAIYWIEVFLATIIISFRMVARHLKNNYGVDDWLMIVTLFMQIALASFVTKYALIGGTRHIYYLLALQMTKILKWNYVLQCWGILAFIPARISVALLINRLMRPFRGYRFWIMVVALTAMTIFNILTANFTYVQCSPVRALWDKSITDAKCWVPIVQARIGIVQASYAVFVDVLLAFIPATLLCTLTMPVFKKAGLCLLLGLGLFAAVAGSIKTSKLVKLGARSDLTWEMYGLIDWSGTENFIVLFCGSVPPLRPFFDRFGGKNGALPSSPHLTFRETGAMQDRSVEVEDNQRFVTFRVCNKSSASADEVSPVPPI